jgi:hypothetical protein
MIGNYLLHTYYVSNIYTSIISLILKNTSIILKMKKLKHRERLIGLRQHNMAYFHTLHSQGHLHSNTV